MISLALILAELPLTPRTSKIPKWLASDVFLICAAALLLFGILAGWILWVRGPKSDLSPARRVYKGSHHVHAPHPEAEPAEPEPAEPSSGSRRKKKKSRRREHRSRNPTLAETGGLPPPRGPETPLIP